MKGGFSDGGLHGGTAVFTASTFHAAAGDSLLVLEQGPTLISKPKTVVRLVNPLTKAGHWKVEFPAGTLVSTLDNDELLVVQLDGKAERIEIATGRRSEPTTCRANGAKRLHWPMTNTSIPRFPPREM